MIKKFDNKTGLSATQLKLIAYACMLLDHFRSEEHTSELQSRSDLVCRLLLGAHV